MDLITRFHGIERSHFLYPKKNKIIQKQINNI
jgi:hypothetical protein